MVLSSSCPEVTPRITPMRSRGSAANWPRAASSSTRCATISASSCTVSVAGTMLGGTPNPRVSNGTGSRKAPRRA